jgi:hypothetical protein
MEKKLILEDIQRIMLFSNYNMDMTLSENTTILENRALYSDVLKSFSRDRAIAKELTLLMKDAKFMSELKAGKIVDMTGKELRTFQEVVGAAKRGTISEKELARFNWAVFKSTPNNSIRIELAKDIVKSDSFIKFLFSILFETFSLKKNNFLKNGKKSFFRSRRKHGNGYRPYAAGKACNFSAGRKLYRRTDCQPHDRRARQFGLFSFFRSHLFQ